MVYKICRKCLFQVSKRYFQIQPIISLFDENFQIVICPKDVPINHMDLVTPEEITYANSKYVNNQFAKNKFLGGRIALRNLLMHQSYNNNNNDNNLRNISILPDNGGAPQLPYGFIGSISHKNDIVIGIIRKQETFNEHIGIDIEHTEHHSNHFKNHFEKDIYYNKLAKRILTVNEMSNIYSNSFTPLLSYDTEILLRFSLKECLYKILYYYTKKYIPFLDVEIINNRSNNQINNVNGNCIGSINCLYLTNNTTCNTSLQYNNDIYTNNTITSVIQINILNNTIHIYDSIPINNIIFHVYYYLININDKNYWFTCIKTVNI
jgi:4'-phosphopantetheinyl transferase EntD